MLRKPSFPGARGLLEGLAGSRALHSEAAFLRFLPFAFQQSYISLSLSRYLSIYIYIYIYEREAFDALSGLAIQLFLLF